MLRTLSLIALLASFTGTATLAQDSKEQAKSKPQTSAEPSVTPPQFSLILYYSSKTDADKAAHARVTLARLGIQHAKKPVSEGGLGAYEGSGSRRAEECRAELISNLNGGPGATKEAVEKASRQADGLLSFLEDGWAALFIADPADKE